MNINNFKNIFFYIKTLLVKIRGYFRRDNLLKHLTIKAILLGIFLIVIVFCLKFYIIPFIIQLYHLNFSELQQWLISGNIALIIKLILKGVLEDMLKDFFYYLEIQGDSLIYKKDNFIKLINKTTIHCSRTMDNSDNENSESATKNSELEHENNNLDHDSVKKERKRIAQKKYRDTHKEELKKKATEYKEKNKEKISLKRKQNHLDNQERDNARSKEYRNDPINKEWYKNKRLVDKKFKYCDNTNIYETPEQRQERMDKDREESRAKQKIANKKFRDTHKEQIKIDAKERRLKFAKETKARNRLNHFNNKDEYNKKKREFYDNNKDAINDNRKKIRMENSDEFNKKARERYAKNKDVVNAKRREKRLINKNKKD